METDLRKHRQTPNRSIRLIFFAAGGLLLSGCTTIPAYQQSYLSKPNMQFEDTIVYNTEPRFQGSYEPGSPTASGAGATGCAACR